MSSPTLRAAARLLVLPVASASLMLGPAPVSHADRATIDTTQTSTVVTPTDAATKKALKKARKKAAAKRAKKRAAQRVERVMRAARSRAGRPYSYGASGPNAFDCSGYTQWVYRQAGEQLPRTSGSQVGATRRIGRPAVGDLVFFHSGGRVYHVGIYAGAHSVWHASRPGVPVKRERIWTGSVFYGRVR